MCIGAIPAFIVSAARSSTSATLSMKVNCILFARAAIFNASYCPYRKPIAMSTKSAPMELITIYLNAASRDSPLSTQNAISAQLAIEVISRKTKKLKRSPVSSIPTIPTVTRSRRV